MKAIAILAFLVGCIATCIASGKYRWTDEAGQETLGTPEPTENVCLSDTSSCGCCLMQQTMHRMEQFFNMSLNALDHSLQETKTALNNIRASRSAFSVALTDRRWCLGPFRTNVTIAYTHIFLNLGSNYNPDSGVFIAPRTGVYSLSLTVYSDSGSAGSHLAACATMTVNNVAVAILREWNAQDQEDSSTSVLALLLSAGDRVCVMLPVGCFLCDNSNHYNTFTGILLYATD